MTKKNQLVPPWPRIVRLKEELRSGALSLAEFAADLHEVTLGQGRRAVYEEPEKFFALTYPTHTLRELVKDVAGRLAGQSDKAVRQLELTYGGGKTHTLITLYHLFRNPEALPDLPAVREFHEHVGGPLPRAFTAALCFDKIDVERGIDGVRAPDGTARTLRHPWSVLAFQLAGADGLRATHGEGRDEERETPPAEPLLVKLIEKPQQRGLATLILIDEVLMYAREKAGLDPVWRDRIRDFFQYLTQAAAKVDRAAIVASLLATDPAKQRGGHRGKRAPAARRAARRGRRRQLPVRNAGPKRGFGAGQSECPRATFPRRDPRGRPGRGWIATRRKSARPSTRCSPPGSRRTSRPMLLLPPPPPRSPGSPRHGGGPAS